MSSDEEMDEAESYEDQIDLFDEQLQMATSDDKKLATYADYIAFEKDMVGEMKTTARVSIVYERAVADFPQSEDLWLDYATWVSGEKTANSLNVYERGCAACPDCTALWQLYLLALEHEGVPYDQLFDKWEGAKASIGDDQDCISVYRSFIYLTHRYLVKNGSDDLSPVEKLFAEGLTLLKENFDAETSKDAITFRKNYAYYLYSKSKKPAEASAIWKEILTHTSAVYQAAPWLEYLLLERLYGSVPQVRHQFYTALARVTDAPYDVFAAFVQFEREEGTLEQLERALDAVNTRNRQLPQKSAKKSNSNKSKPGSMGKRQQKEKAHAAGGKQRVVAERNKKPTDGKPSGVKRASGYDDTADADAPSKKAKATERSKEVESNVDEHGFKRPMLPPPRKAAKDAKSAEASASSLNFNLALPPTLATSSVDDELMDTHGEESGSSETHASTHSSFYYSTGVENNKLFVRNVHFSCSSDELKEHFLKYGKVKSVRIVTHKDGKPKGVAYVDFTNDDEAQKGLRADGSKLRDRKLKVLISNPPPKSGTGSSEKPNEKPRDAPAASSSRTAAAPNRPPADVTTAMPMRVPRGLFVPRSVAKPTSATPANGTSNGTNGN